MGEEIAYATGSITETWIGDHLGVVRVHHGVLNPEAQPIFNEDGSVCVVMDGEVFDYDRERRLLENRGHRFRFPDNDAEYCLHLYEEYGDDAFPRLNGSFTLLFHDAGRREIILANDRFASYPLYLYSGVPHTVFGTQLRPLLRFAKLPRILDLQAVFEFFALGRVLPGHTYYQGVSALAPATVVRVGDSEQESARYWTATYGNQDQPESAYAEALAGALKVAVIRKTRGKHRLGLLLSGGIDSRTVLACADRPLVAFTLAEFENREVKIARRVAGLCGCEHIFLKRTFDHYPNLVEEAVAIGDGMHRFDHALVLGLIPEIRSRCDVLLDALNFDSALEGSHLVHVRRALLGRPYHTSKLANVSTVASLDIWAKTRAYRGGMAGIPLFRPQYARPLGDALLASLITVANQAVADDAQDRIEYALVGSLSSKGSQLMPLAVRAHMGQRSVIADNDLWSVALSIPPSLRAKARVLRKALKRISPELAAIPNANTGFRADLAVGLEWFLVSSRIALRDLGAWPRPKVPHPAFTHRSWPYWSGLIRHNDKLRTMIETTIRDPECLNPDLFDREAAIAILERHMQRREDHGRWLFQLLTFGWWHKRYGPA
jgi:asparagine synthase (glutamine-hydrolysing)